MGILLFFAFSETGVSAFNANDTNGLAGPADDVPPLDEQRLIARIRTGDQAAFEEMFLVYMPRLSDFVYRYVGSQDDAQEMVQEIFLKLWRLRAQFHVRGSLADYLYFAARNSVRDRFAHERVVRAWAERTVAERDAAGDERDAVDAQAVLESAERHAAIARALAELPERRRAVCTLRWVNGLSYAEIAQRLGITEKTVANQLDRGFRELKQKLSGI